MNTILGIRTERKPAYYELISPEVAKMILHNNEGNRNISNVKVIEYYNKMVQGKYKEGTGEPIKISNKGRLLDGQHRLTALIKADITIEFLVARDLDEMVFDVLDTGKGRGAADVLSMVDAPNAALCSAMLKCYKSTKNGNNERYKFSNAEILDVYKEDRDKYDEIATMSMRLHKTGKVFSSSIIGGLMLVFMEKNQIQAHDFFNQLCRVSPVRNSTVEALYQKFVEDAISTKKLQPQVKIRLIIKAWNAFRAGKELVRISYKEAEGLPNII